MPTGMNTKQDIKMQMDDDKVGYQVLQLSREEGQLLTEQLQVKPRNGDAVIFRTVQDCSKSGRSRIQASKDTLQQASTSGTQSDNAPVYDSDGSTEELLNQMLFVLSCMHVLLLAIMMSVAYYVNDMNSRADNQSVNVSKLENQKKHKANVRKSKEFGSQGSLASSRHSKPRNCLWWVQWRFLAICGKINLHPVHRGVKSDKSCVTSKY
ncbi:hypothetical protein Tco_0549252 [Tanacetum coccineum]